MRTGIGTALGLVAGLGVCGSSAPALSAPKDEVSKGIEGLAAGRYQDAVATLTGVVARMPERNGKRDPKAARVFLHLGLAYAGLGEAASARSQLLLALTRDPRVAPDPRVRSASNMGLLEAARREAEEKGLLPGREPRRGSTRVALGLGLGGAAIVAVAATAFGAGADASPGTAPTIANLVVGEVQAVDSVRGVLPLEFDYEDPDADVLKSSVLIGDRPPAINALPGAQGQRAGHARVVQSFDLPPRGVTLDVVVRVLDAREAPSNDLRGVLVWP